MSRIDDPVARGGVARSSFYAGMRVLPPRERAAMYAIYAFCRDVDDIADDEGHTRPARAAALEQWRADLHDLFAGGPGGQAHDLAQAVRDFDLQHADFAAVIDGMAMDVDDTALSPGWATLDLYCDRVASAVGRLSVRVFGMEHDAGVSLAHHLGRALQLTNILRDIDEDAAIGRLYLPSEALAAAHVDRSSPAHVAADPRLNAAAREVAARAAAHFAEADRILARRQPGHLTAPKLMSAAYAGLLRRMVKAGWAPPRTRQRVNKAALLGRLILMKLIP